MRAAVFQAAGENLRIEDRQRPSAGPGEIVLRVAYCGICGSDLHATEANPIPLPPGIVLGHEFSGTVVESQSPDWQIGERAIGIPLQPCAECMPVGRCKEGLGILCPKGGIIGLSPAAPGGYAEYVKLMASHALRVPETVDLRTAALAEPLAVGAHAVRLAGALLGARVLVIGAGPIGLAVTIFARLAGARDVVVSEPDPDRRGRAEKFGATGTIDPLTEPLAKGFIRHAGERPEVIFECVGAPGLLRECFDTAAIHGRVVVVGVNRGEDTVFPRVAIRKELTIRFALGYVPADFRLVLDVLESGRIDAPALITAVIGLDALPAMFESLRARNPHAKVLIDPSM